MIITEAGKNVAALEDHDEVMMGLIAYIELCKLT